MNAMSNRTQYEWDIELYLVQDGEDGDVLDHSHAVSLTEFSPQQISDAILRVEVDGRAPRLVLVRDYGGDLEGLKSRQWAYVEEKKLPETFDNEAAIPARFRKELEQAVSRITERSSGD